MKVAVKMMEEVMGLADAIKKKFHDQSRVINCQNCRPSRTAKRPNLQRRLGGTHQVEDKGILCQRLERSITFRVSIRLQ